MDLEFFNFNYWFLQTVAMMLTALIIPNLTVTGPFGAFITVFAIAFINSKVWDAALFFQLPDTLTVQALVLFFSNGTIFWILVKLLPGIEVTGFLPALIAPLVFTVCSLLIDEYAKDIDWLNVLNYIIDRLQDLAAYLREHTVERGTPGSTQ